MTTTEKNARRRLGAVLAVTAVGGAAVAALAGIAGPSATAASDPCAASEIAKSIGSVVTSTGNYLDAHPETNQALTTISQQQAGPQSIGSLKAYFDANPQVGKDMGTIQQPLISLSSQCKLPISLPQLVGLLGGMPGGGLPGGLPTGALPTGALPPGLPLPAGLPAAQAVGAPSAVAPALPAPATAVTPVTGPLPGPATTTAG
jgi:hemophore